MSAMKLGMEGFAKFGWLNRLKKSARICRVARSVRAVFLNTPKLNSLKLGPRRPLRRRLPKWRVPATQLLSSFAPGLRVGSHVQGAANAARSRYCAGLPGL